MVACTHAVRKVMVRYKLFITSGRVHCSIPRGVLCFAPASASSDYYEVVDADDDDDTNGDDSE